jgi:hypothetical protein
VRSVLVRIATDRDELARLQADIDALRQRAQEHERRGWTLDRLAEIARSAALAPTELNRESVDAVTASLKQQRTQHLAQLAEAVEERQTLDDQVALISHENSVPSRSARGGRGNF